MKLADRIFKRNDYKITSPYGSRVHPITGKNSMHNGTDYGTKGQKWNQYAIEEGIVISAGKDTSASGQGALFAWVSYPRLNIKLLHYHLDQVFVKKGQSVDEHTVIGTTGTTGQSTGIHLHLGAKHLDSNKYFDPHAYDYSPQAEQPKPIEKPKPAEPKPEPSAIKVGDVVKVFGERYATGQRIPSWVKIRKHTVAQLKDDRALLKEILSWVFIKDIKKV